MRDHARMETLLVLVLVLVLLLAVAAVLLLRRLEGMDARLATLARLDALDKQLQSLAGQFERREFSVALQAKLTEFAEGQARLAAAVTGLQEALAAVPHAPAAAPAGDLLGMVREHLVAQHYEGVRLLTDAAQLAGRSGRVVFEARRDGVLHKGLAVVADGEVVEDSARGAWSAFP
jgi:hypothetical protein